MPISKKRLKEKCEKEIAAINHKHGLQTADFKTSNRENSLDPEPYKEKIQFLNEQFGNARFGTKIVNYCGEGKEIPDSYAPLKSSNKGKLKFWVKQ